jgi:ornithine cyclodeaminase/alanine dehydrogenase-like protein (mu-crystallin family)
MADNIIGVLYDKANRIESSQVKKPAKISSIINNCKKKNEGNKKSFKKALLDADKHLLEEEKLHKDNTDSVIISSSLAHLIEENNIIGPILKEKIASNPRLKEILREKTGRSSEPLDRSKINEN